MSEYSYIRIREECDTLRVKLAEEVAYREEIVLDLVGYVHDENDALKAKLAALVGACRTLSGDMHCASCRPCSTCASVSDVLGESFGCVARAEMMRPKPKEDKDEAKQEE